MPSLYHLSPAQAINVSHSSLILPFCPCHPSAPSTCDKSLFFVLVFEWPTRSNPLLTLKILIFSFWTRVPRIEKALLFRSYNCSRIFVCWFLYIKSPNCRYTPADNFFPRARVSGSTNRWLGLPNLRISTLYSFPDSTLFFITDRERRTFMRLENNSCNIEDLSRVFIFTSCVWSCRAAGLSQQGDSVLDQHEPPYWGKPPYEHYFRVMSYESNSPVAPSGFDLCIGMCTALLRPPYSPYPF